MRIPFSLYYDPRDHALLSMVNRAMDGGITPDHARKAFYPYLHPRGIKEMAEARGLRIAFAVFSLINSLETGRMQDRLSALASVVEEARHAVTGTMVKNTARVLLQIMKDLVRVRGDYGRQLALAHDFRMAASGKPRVIRALLQRYHLLEMPEEWNQITFDDHVHDAFTKGRKSPTHLIMDAWIKGIRRLRVIYYNHVEPVVAAELLEAANIMGVDVRIGVEFSARFRDRFTQLIWTPRGFADSQAFLCFLAEPMVMAFMEEGRKVSAYQAAPVLTMLSRYNEKHRHALARDYGIAAPELSEKEFAAYVGKGQMSLLHLAGFIHQALSTTAGSGPDQERVPDPETIGDRYLRFADNPDVPDPSVPLDGPDVPQFLQLAPRQVIQKLSALHTGHRITLNLTDLALEDVIEILYQCEGTITRLEIFNLKDYLEDKAGNIAAINEFMNAVNESNLVRIQGVIRSAMEAVSRSEYPDKQDRLDSLDMISHDIISLKAWYAVNGIKARMGSDSTGRSIRRPGMGFAALQSLPARTVRVVKRTAGPQRMVTPVQITLLRHKVYVPRVDLGAGLRSFCSRREARAAWGWPCRKVKEVFEVEDHGIRLTGDGNVVSLGGVGPPTGDVLSQKTGQRPGFFQMNTVLRNLIKVVAGFIPAFLTFYLTKDWWVLAYLGAPIWFLITGARNVVQAVLGGGGLRRSPLLKWNDMVSWERISDSLFFTGLSVPLLEYLVKILLLQKGLSVTTVTHPLILYAVLAVANGLYLASHNLYRGLPRAAVIGNLFRSILAIPLAYGINEALASLLGFYGVAAAELALQKWAAIISKAASDCVAAIIEGLADRNLNLAARRGDYADKFRQLAWLYEQVELMFPDAQANSFLEKPERFSSNAEARDLEKIFILNALDMLYFWMYQPRSRKALAMMVEDFSDEERKLFTLSQDMLLRKKPIARMILDGILDPQFSRPL
ncbi:MAG: hypothetical protein AB1921_06130, partial [Thermodesulfobacteriota bacterium]